MKDEDNWYSLLKEAGILDVKWPIYSLAYYKTIDGYNTFKYTGNRLKLYVRHELGLYELRQRQMEEVRAYTEQNNPNLDNL